MPRLRQDFADRYGPWALVTGASSGIGAEFARQLAAAGLAVALVARRRERLTALAEELHARHRVATQVVAADLARADAATELAAAVGQLDLGLVVCNAGTSWKGRFLEQDPAEQRRMIEVNCQAPVALTRALGPRLASRGRGGLVIVSSTGAFQGLPWSAVYGATKAFDLLLGEALAIELAADGVDVLTLCPGGTDTEGPMNSGVDPTKVPGKLMAVGPVVTAALAGLGRRTLVIPGATNRLAAVATRAVPRAVAARTAGRIMRRVTGR
ncbi:MAG: SDR family NAD(P)-dependent oxidoreductase [Kofleriaceae bacterium]|jgi:short-subunit dehydrogenase|nr:SDR family NAD(P)-dependent oxidoreductase [Kofleriaceae bacterium]MBP9168051.1 SDR family NAD(P)-dependent oxidoreductase [Kofleriaceae bacterium]MBP9856885.1 SDR family NAD(P)-dependent oxidoreductase [Kofleriaceae bacterium]